MSLVAMMVNVAFPVLVFCLWRQLLPQPRPYDCPIGHDVQLGPVPAGTADANVDHAGVLTELDF
jgi:hypothetical protein